MDDTIESIREVLSESSPVDVAFVFGSASRDQLKDDSDVDVAVAGATALSSAEKMTLIEALALATGRPVDLIDLRTSPPLVFRQALTTGTCVVRRDRTLYADLLKRLWYDHADLLPLHDQILTYRRAKFIPNSSNGQMDRSIVQAKLEVLRHCLHRIEIHTPASSAELQDDEDRQDIISVNLERAVQSCVDIAAHVISDSDIQPPSTMGGVFVCMGQLQILPESLVERLRKAVGFRNIAVHSYQDVDWAIVYAIITTRLEDFRGFAKYVSVALGEDPLKPSGPPRL